MQLELAQLKQAQQAQQFLPSPESSLPVSQSRDETTSEHFNSGLHRWVGINGAALALSIFVASPFLGSANASTSQAASAPTPERLAMPNLA